MLINLRSATMTFNKRFAKSHPVDNCHPPNPFPPLSGFQSVEMFTRLKGSGGIEDLGLGLRWDAATLTHEALRRASVLSREGIGLGTVVAILHSGTAHFFADLFATWAIGATALCLDSTLPEKDIQATLKFAKPAAILVHQTAVATNLSIPVLELTTVPSFTELVTTPAVDLDNPALILFTSGSTGTPKGVVLHFQALLERISLNLSVIGKGALARSLVTIPTHFGHGIIGNALTPLLAWCDIVLYPLGT